MPPLSSTAPRPTIPVIAEEEAARGACPALAGRDRFWLVDPLDGTREFVSRNGEFTVNIGLIHAGAPAGGVVLTPVTGDGFAGAVGRGAWRWRGGGGLIPIAARSAPADGVDVLASRSHRDAETDRYLAGVAVRRLIAAGSSLKFCRIAAGEADLYPRFGPTMEWDTAAGHAVLAAAGGSVGTPDGAPLTYGKPGFRNPAFIARGA
jgi:3'(2'), 5'-bisphosphate nucleotidase